MPAAVPPKDDAGAQTLDRYEWQAAMATADAFRLVAEFNQEALGESYLLCEVHEDWVIVSGSDFELVSAKHRDLTQGPWKTLNQLVGDGGVGHLYAAWVETARAGRSRLVTNAPLTADAAALSLATRIANMPASERSPDQSARLDEFARSICREAAAHLGDRLPEPWRIPTAVKKSAWQVPQEFIADFVEFLKLLRVDDDRPVRLHALEAAPSLWVEDLLVARGASPALAREVWTAVHALCRARMRAGGSRLSTPIAAVRDSVASKDLNLNRRVLSVEDVLQVIEIALRNPGAFEKPRRAKGSRVQLKMVDGGCAETSIERAEILRIAYVSKSRDVRQAEITSDGFSEAEMRLLKLCDDLVAKYVSLASGVWGPAYWAEISREVEDPAFSSDLSLTPDLALGAICELSNQCNVWFGPWFDVDKRIASNG